MNLGVHWILGIEFSNQRWHCWLYTPGVHWLHSLLAQAGLISAAFNLVVNLVLHGWPLPG
jgi:hypothetical protein